MVADGESVGWSRVAGAELYRQRPSADQNGEGDMLTSYPAQLF